MSTTSATSKTMTPFVKAPEPIFMELSPLLRFAHKVPAPDGRAMGKRRRILAYHPPTAAALRAPRII
jgi:hypothetical protein